MYNAAVFCVGSAQRDRLGILPVAGVPAKGLLMRLMLIGIVAAALSSSLFAADPAVVDRYNKTCAICHGSGVANAPKFGDAAQWEPRLAKGSDALINSVKNGLNAMPPKGMCMDCSDADYKALIDYMVAGK